MNNTSTTPAAGEISQPILHNNGADSFCLVQVPQHATSPYLNHDGTFLYYHGNYNWDQPSIALPPGSWQLLGRASELSEEHIKQVVQLVTVECERVPSVKYRNYEKGSRFNYAEESFTSLLSSHNLQPESTIILKQEK